MKNLLLAALTAVAMAGLSSTAHAFSISLDVPTQYTLNDQVVDSSKSAKVKDTTSSDVRGFKIAIAGMHHIGVAYETYESDFKGQGGGGNTFKITPKLQFYDVLLDFPTHVLNFGLGYGAGSINTVVQDNSGTHVASAPASQVFASVGFPFNDHFDIHAEYHAVTAGDQKLSSGGAPSGDKVNLSGHTVMAGIRLAWGGER